MEHDPRLHHDLRRLATDASSAHLVRSLFIMASMVEARDPYTGGHLWRVSQYARLLAQHLGLPPAEVAKTALAGFLHDIGKIAVPDAILNKRDKLTDDEIEVVRTHATVGARLLADHPLAPMVLDGVLMHHETADGAGYPARKSLDEIPPAARIVGLADAFDAMTSNRPYRRELPKAQAIEIVAANLGRQFDVEVGAAFLALARTSAVDHILGHSEPGIPVQTCPMCGPTIVVRRDHAEGDLVYCPICHEGDFVHRHDGGITLVPANRRAKPLDLAPAVDLGLIDELVAQACRLLEQAEGGPVDPASGMTGR